MNTEASAAVQPEPRASVTAGDRPQHQDLALAGGGRAAALRTPSQVVFRGALALLSTQPITWIATLLTTAFVPHFLGARGLGEYAVALSFADLVGTFVALGMPTYLIRRVATHPGEAQLTAGGALVLLALLSISVAAVIALLIPAAGVSETQARVVRIALLGMVVATVQNALFSLLIGRERHGWFATLNAACVLVTAVAGVAALAAGTGLTGLMLVGVAAGLFMFAVNWLISGLRITRAAVSPRLWLQLGRGGLPFLGWSVALKIRMQIDVVLVALLTTQSVAGWLAAAYRIIGIPVFIPTLITVPLIPALSRVASDRDLFTHTLQRSLEAVFILTVPCCAGIIALSPSIPHLLHWPSEFYHSELPMAILACQQPIVAVDMVLVTALSALHAEHKWLRVAVFGALFNPLINAVLLPQLWRTGHNAAAGAAIVEVCTELVMLVGTLLLLPRGMLGRSTVNKMMRVVLAAAILCVVASSLRVWSIPLAIGGGAATYLVAVLTLRAVSAGDLRQLATMALGSRGVNLEASTG